MLLDYGANTNIITAPIWGSCTPLHEAVERSHHDIVTMLLRAGANPNIRNNTGDTALHICRDIDSANVLLDYHADLTITNNLGFTVLHSAAEKGYTHNIVMLLCTRGVNIDTKIADDIQSHRAGYIALHIAAALGHLETVRTLLTNGADVTVEGVDGYTAMHLASRSHHFAIVTLMRSFLVNGYLLK